MTRLARSVALLLGGVMLAVTLTTATEGTALAQPPQQPAACVGTAAKPRALWGSRIYHSAGLKQVVNKVPRWLGYPVEAGAMLTAVTLGSLDRLVHRRH